MTVRGGRRGFPFAGPAGGMGAPISVRRNLALLSFDGQGGSTALRPVRQGSEMPANRRAGRYGAGGAAISNRPSARRFDGRSASPAG